MSVYVFFLESYNGHPSNPSHTEEYVWLRLWVNSRRVSKDPFRGRFSPVSPTPQKLFCLRISHLQMFGV